MAPIIAALIKAGLPMIAGAVVNMGKEVVQEKFGIDLTSALGSEEGKLQLKQLEIDHQEFLIQASMNEAAMYLEDVASARDREWKVAQTDAPWLSKVIVPLLASGVLCLTFIIFSVLIFDSSTIEASRKEVMIYILGVLSAISTQIIQYYFGSSKGSAMKDETINLMQGVTK